MKKAFHDSRKLPPLFFFVGRKVSSFSFSNSLRTECWEVMYSFYERPSLLDLPSVRKKGVLYRKMAIYLFSSGKNKKKVDNRCPSHSLKRREEKKKRIHVTVTTDFNWKNNEMFFFSWLGDFWIKRFACDSVMLDQQSRSFFCLIILR